jgi:hypothetical protein
MKREWRYTKERSGGKNTEHTQPFHDCCSFTLTLWQVEDRNFTGAIIDAGQSMPQSGIGTALPQIYNSVA